MRRVPVLCFAHSPLEDFVRPDVAFISKVWPKLPVGCSEAAGKFACAAVLRKMGRAAAAMPFAVGAASLIAEALQQPEPPPPPQQQQQQQQQAMVKTLLQVMQRLMERDAGPGRSTDVCTWAVVSAAVNAAWLLACEDQIANQLSWSATW